MNTEEKVQWVYNSQNNQELAERYDVWAKDYDRDLLETFGRTLNDPSIQQVVKYVPKNARLLDAGAGTGLVGEYLHQQGYTNLTAIDISEGMLAEARKRNVYTELHQMVLGEPLAFADDSFDAIISIGVFTVGHAPSRSFDELIRISKPGGKIVFTMRTNFYESSDFKEKFAALETALKWELVDNDITYQAMPKAEPDVYLQVWVYQKC
jgi:SAM-dependent methyltransferase